MSSGSSVIRAMMLRDAAAARQQARAAEYAARPGAGSKVARPAGVAPAGQAALYMPPISPTSADQGFSDMLAMASTRYMSPLLAALGNQQAAGVRSRMLQPGGTTSPATSPAQADTRGAGGAPAGPPPYSDLIASTAKKYDVSPSLVAAVVKAESGFDPKAVSKAGAKGLMQLMDGTARTLGVTNPFDPNQNIDGGTRFLSGLLKRYNGNTTLALAAYNAGESAVENYGGIPPYKETKDFVSAVLGYWRQFSEAFHS
ncbi:MAG: lytic transglycosylase domain-containing protein [Bacteroidetes bacterium]|nr:lytic transglycosylase domain-containing protein [Bacteroidota bacterium]MCL5025240.1 lytic transglycosylase domain-containing protein [Chloroflexota bacterium]